MNALLGLLSDVGYALDTPGAYVRGALAGRPGDRVSGEDLLGAYGVDGGPVGGFLAETLLDPVDLLAGGGLGALGVSGINRLTRGARGLAGSADASPLARALGGFAGDESGQIDLARFGLHRAPYTTEEIASLSGRSARPIGLEEAGEAYRPWVEGLFPEERATIPLYTSGPQSKISHALRGSSELSGGKSYDPFDPSEQIFGSVAPGTVPINTPADVMEEVVPYLDSALSRGAAPKDLVTHRLGSRLGDLTPENAREMIGREVSDPSYMSTTITPWGRFYGNDVSQRNMLMDIVIPDAGPGGYVDDLSRWGEDELLLPRAAPMRVLDAQGVPTVRLHPDDGGGIYRLDAEGKPIPPAGQFGGELFNSEAFDDLLGDGAIWKKLQGRQGDFVMPDDLMAPGWYDKVRRGEGGEQMNVLLEMLAGADAPSHMRPHLPAVRRRTGEELVEMIRRSAESSRSLSPARLDRELGLLAREAGEAGYPLRDRVEDLVRAGAVPPEFSLDRLLRSFPR